MEELSKSSNTGAIKIDILFDAPKNITQNNSKEKLSKFESALRNILDIVNGEKMKYLLEIQNSKKYDINLFNSACVVNRLSLSLSLVRAPPLIDIKFDSFLNRLVLSVLVHKDRKRSCELSASNCAQRIEYFEKVSLFILHFLFLISKGIGEVLPKFRRKYWKYFGVEIKTRSVPVN